MDATPKSGAKVQSGHCPDEQCNEKLFFPAKDLNIECSSCGQRHLKGALKNLQDVTDPGIALHNILKNILLGATKPKKSSDEVKVQGISNYQCKLLSCFLTKYGMDKHTGKAQLLTEMGQPETFDCSILADRNFLLESDLIDINGYGRDKTGSMNYLKDTLDAVKLVNNNEERLLPIHADGDGHCLVHALSRALVGRELFWHALRVNLKNHFQKYIGTYKGLFKEFIDFDEWKDIIEECDPDYSPMDGEPLGLRNVHILGLAHVLRRPIILLDSLHGLNSSGDYTGVFIPGLFNFDTCSKAGKPNPPLCLAWSNQGRNHYIALVAVRGRPVPKIPPWMLPKAWGMPQELLDRYFMKDEKGNIIIGGEKCLQDKYILRLIGAMEELFFETFHVNTSLVADLHQYVYKSQGLVGIHHETVLRETQLAVREKRLYRCTRCDAITRCYTPEEWLLPGGKLYELCISIHKRLDPTKKYNFPNEGIICSYNQEKDILEVDHQGSKITMCNFCQCKSVRLVTGDGRPVYENGDRTKTRAAPSSRCTCGFKHFWDGREYDNLPDVFPVNLEWNGKVVQDMIVWFEYESDPSLNSNVYEVAQTVVQKHFPGEFGSERLVQSVVDKIMRHTAMKAKELPEAAMPATEDPLNWQPDTATKVILTGPHSKTMHKEEKSVSQKEKNIKKQMQAKAPLVQNKKTDELARQQGAKGKATPGSPIKATAKQSKIEAKQPSTTADTANASSGGLNASAGGSSLASEMPPTKKVKVSASDGRQLFLHLESDLTFRSLQQKLEHALDVPAERQRIKHGFPPKVLPPPADADEESRVLPLQHGDRITVEILPDPTDARPEVPIREPVDPWPMKKQARHSWSSFDPNSHDASEQSMLQGLENLQNETHDPLDTNIASLQLIASLAGRDLWTYVQGMPHLFSVGGLFYEKTRKLYGLVDGKHSKLPQLPGKSFRYNALEDRLELCLEPHGHFPIEPGIEDKVKNSSLMGAILDHARSQRLGDSCESVGQTLSAGGSGVVVNPSMKSGAIPFSGHGHSLSGANARMPGDLNMPPSHGKHKTRRLSDPGSRHESISEDNESEENQTGTGAIGENVPMRRIGPGFTVLDQAGQNQFNQTADALYRLATQIESIVEDEEASQDVAESDQQQMDLDLPTPVTDQCLPMQTSSSSRNNASDTRGAYTSKNTAVDSSSEQSFSVNLNVKLETENTAAENSGQSSAHHSGREENESLACDSGTKLLLCSQEECLKLERSESHDNEVEEPMDSN